MSTSIKDIMEQINAAKKALKKVSHKQIREWFTPVFDKFPELDSFGWNQYVPAFNDGDPCMFTVSDISRINGTDEDDDYEAFKAVRGDYCNPKPMYKALNKLFFELPEEIKETLGENVSVTISRTGIAVEEYDCGH